MAEGFVGVRVVGGLLPAELLSRINAGQLSGQQSGDYHLAPGETVREAANRAWAYLTGVWSTYWEAAQALPEGDWGTTLTRDRWLQILFRELGYGRVQTTAAGGIVVDGKATPISHLWDHVPMHLLGHRVELDSRTKGLAGAATSSPQSMVQDLLNRSDEHLWAVLSNGRVLRLLRDSTSLVGSSYLEFDLETIFEGELFSDFLLLFSLCHESRLEIRDEEVGPASCWLEQWRTESIETGTRALDQLRGGVVDAILTLGTGFLAHPANAHLRDGLANSSLRIDDVNHALLRVVYRLLFTFVAEDRGLLLDPKADAQAKSRFNQYFSTARLRRHARRRGGTRHSDQWRALNLVWDGLADVDGRPELGLVGIGGLFEAGPLDIFRDAELSNQALLSAVRHLSVVEEPGSKVRRVVDYRNLGAEELGSIYEALLEYVPAWNSETRQFELKGAAGNDRKSTGSYYTPTSLIETLLESALEPVLDRAEKSDDPQDALLSISVVDPACGSGHFLVAAARQIAKRVAAIRTGDPEPPPERVREALRDVVGRCIYGVDLNPLAAELAKVSLWLETLEPGKPLAFLDAQIKVGNSLMGATPALIADGVPDDAFRAIEGDDKRIATQLKKQNKQERSGQADLFGDEPAFLKDAIRIEFGVLMDNQSPKSLAQVAELKQRLAALDAKPDLKQQKLVADAWCAAFVWPKQPGVAPAPTDGVVRALARGEEIDPDTLRTIQELAAEYQFFHWHLEFPHLFRDGGPADGPGWDGGFDAVLGNPPWEHVELKEVEFFAVRAPEIADASGAKRKSLIAKLPDVNPALAADFARAKRNLDASRHLLANSGLYPLTGRGRVKTDSVFAELGRRLQSSTGRFGMILPTGIATDATTQYFFKDLVQSRTLASLYDFENAKPLFEGVHRSFKFCLLTLTGHADAVPEAQFAFFAHDPADLNKENARFELTPEEIQLLNPNTGTCPIFRTRRDAEITLGIYRRVPVLINENDPVNGNPWGISFMQGLFNMTSDSHLFHTREELEDDGWVLNGNVFERETSGGGIARMLPLYEAKMLHLYDTRWATYEPDGSVRPMTEEEKASRKAPMPRYWVAESEVDKKLDGKWDKQWTLGWRKITRATDARTLIPTRVPDVGLGDSWCLALPDASPSQPLQACWSSFALDFAVRQKLGGINMTFFTVEQLPVPRPRDFAIDVRFDRETDSWIGVRVDRLNGWIPDQDERARVRAELDGFMFHRFGLDRSEVEYVMGTFPIVERKDRAEFGTYRTKDLILEAYDALAKAKATNTVYQSPWNGDSNDS